VGKCNRIVLSQINTANIFLLLFYECTLFFQVWHRIHFVKSSITFRLLILESPFLNMLNVYWGIWLRNNHVAKSVILFLYSCLSSLQIFNVYLLVTIALSSTKAYLRCCSLFLAATTSDSNSLFNCSILYFQTRITCNSLSLSIFSILILYIEIFRSSIFLQSS